MKGCPKKVAATISLDQFRESLKRWEPIHAPVQNFIAKQGHIFTTTTDKRVANPLCIKRKIDELDSALTTTLG